MFSLSYNNHFHQTYDIITAIELNELRIAFMMWVNVWRMQNRRKTDYCNHCPTSYFDISSHPYIEIN